MFFKLRGYYLLKKACTAFSSRDCAQFVEYMNSAGRCNLISPVYNSSICFLFILIGPLVFLLKISQVLIGPSFPAVTYIPS